MAATNFGQPGLGPGTLTSWTVNPADLTMHGTGREDNLDSEGNEVPTTCVSRNNLIVARMEMMVKLNR
jgi:hypothetical protein